MMSNAGCPARPHGGLRETRCAHSPPHVRGAHLQAPIRHRDRAPSMGLVSRRGGVDNALHVAMAQKPATSGEGAAYSPAPSPRHDHRMRRPRPSIRRAGIDTWTVERQRYPTTIPRRNTGWSNRGPTSPARAGTAPAGAAATSTMVHGHTRRACPSAASRTTCRRTVYASTTRSRDPRLASGTISASVSIGLEDGFQGDRHLLTRGMLTIGVSDGRRAPPSPSRPGPRARCGGRRRSRHTVAGDLPPCVVVPDLPDWGDASRHQMGADALESRQTLYTTLRGLGGRSCDRDTGHRRAA